MHQHMVYAYGILTPSTLFMIEGHYPKPDAYAEIKSIYKMTGGEACNSSIVLSKLNVSVVLDGLWLGDNTRATELLDYLKSSQIDTHLISIQKGFQNVEETVIADQNTRTIFANYGMLYKNQRLWNLPNEEIIKRACVVCLDPFLQNESKDIAKTCVKHNIPYVSIDCHYDDYIAQHAAVLIISGEYRKRIFSEIEKDQLFNQYIKQCKGTVLFTSAEDDIVYNAQGIKKFKPYQVVATDTTGAGDAFRAGIVYGMLMNYPLEKTIAFSSLLASYICQSFPGVMNSPTYEQLMDFSIKQQYDYIERFC
jgi:sugar/nucleoside kinase (ribokinase family)